MENRDGIDPASLRAAAPVEERDDVDLVLRHVSRQYPEAVAQALVRSREPIEVGGWIDTQVSGRQRRLDRALEVFVGGEPALLHVEWQPKMTADLPFRVYEHHVLLSLAQADLARPDREPLPIDSVVVLLSGRDARWPPEGDYRTSRTERCFSGVRFRIEPVYQYTVAELMARDSPLWLIFAPLAVDASEQSLPQVIEALRARTSRRQMEELSVAMSVLADADTRKRGLRAVITSLLPEDVIMESWVYKQGKAKGQQEGIVGLLSRRLERRLSRPLTSPENEALVRRLGTLGSDRLGDLVFDLSPEALAAWVAAPDAG